MKHNTCSNKLSLELQVATILLDLEYLIVNKQSLSCQLSLLTTTTTTWGAKKRRSNTSNNDFSSLQGSSRVDYNQETVPKAEVCHINWDDKRTSIKSEVVVTSPATPLSFSPSESDDKSKHHSSRKLSKRKTREELMDMINQLSQCRESLKGEVENVRNYYNNQKAYNLKLKAMKEQVTRMLNMQGPGINLGQLYNNPEVEFNHQQPFIVDQITLGSETFHRFQYSLGQLQQAQPMCSSSNNTLGSVNNTGLGPLGLPDLNVTVDETFAIDSPSPFDHERIKAERKAQFAAARKRRMIKRIEIKNSSGLVRPLRRR